MIAALIATSLGASTPVANPPAPPPPARITAPAATAPAAGGSLGFLTADTLAERCKDKAPGAISYCYAYITGVHDAMKAYEIWLGQREFCLPSSTSQAELRQSFLGYLSAYPANRTGQAASVVAIALRETYPCGLTGSKPSTPHP